MRSFASDSIGFACCARAVSCRARAVPLQFYAWLNYVVIAYFILLVEYFQLASFAFTVGQSVNYAAFDTAGSDWGAGRRWQCPLLQL